MPNAWGSSWGDPSAWAVSWGEEVTPSGSGGSDDWSSNQELLRNYYRKQKRRVRNSKALALILAANDL